LSSPSLDKPVADSLAITHYLASLYPSLLPPSHKERITKALQDLHALNYFSLSFAGRVHVAQGSKDAVMKRLEGEISDRYREALKYKLEV
jgi:glutathione S-transferase